MKKRNLQKIGKFSRGLPALLGLFMVLLSTTVLALPGETIPMGLAWTQNTESDLAGYRLYFVPSALGLTDPAVRVYEIPGTSSGPHVRFSDLNIPEGEEWIYAVTAYDQSGNESQFSGTVIHTLDSTAPQPPGGFHVQIIINVY
jgi:hypothetical protein